MTKTVIIIQYVKVTIDESKFNDAFLQEFRESYYPFHTLEEHLEHLAQLYARGIYDNGDFIEGYGEAKDMGIIFETKGTETEIE